MRYDVVLINMPFAPLLRPSIALSLLKPVLARENLSVKVLYFTFPFAERIDADRYIRFSNQPPQPSDQLGEWVFSSTLFKDAPLFPYMQQLLNRYVSISRDGASPQAGDSGLQKLVKEALALRTLAGTFLRECAEKTLSFAPRLVGFTSVFQQNVASLALAKRLKQARPELPIVFGGDNCEEVMGAELIRQFPFVDAAVSGEGEIVFPQLADRMLNGAGFSDLPGVYTKDNVEQLFASGTFSPAPQVADLDQLPFPDYSDYFDQFGASRIQTVHKPQLLFETSRGCWWGERSHCTFCGLSPDSMSYRSKSPARALDELQHLTHRHPGLTVTAVDNILNMKYFQDFLPVIAQQNMELEMFYEVKANLKKHHLRMLQQAGIRMIQPGIESFSSAVLDYMGKGVRALQNVQLLKWCKELGIQPFWNVIWGFPKEKPDDYQQMIEWLPLLTHLSPPQSCGPIRLDRFSPNYRYATEYGFKDVKPYPAYFNIYPFREETLSNLAYYFTFGYGHPMDLPSYVTPVWDALSKWWKVSEESDLFFVDKEEAMLIWDFRPVARDPLTVVTHEQRELYLACDNIRTLEELSRMYGRPANVLEETLQELLDRRLMVRENHSYLSLAVPLGEYTPNAKVTEQFYLLVQKYGALVDEHVLIPLPA